MSQRIDRVDQLLRQEISEILAREVADPRIGFVTVTKVDTSPDLAHARVWVSLIGQPAERSATIGALRRALPFVRHELGGRVRLRRIPELHLEVDETAERGTRVLQLLQELEAGREPDELPPSAESLPSPAPRQRASEDVGAEREEGAETTERPDAAPGGRPAGARKRPAGSGGPAGEARRAGTARTSRRSGRRAPRAGRR